MKRKPQRRFRLGLYDADPDVRHVEYVGREFRDNRSDRGKLRRIVKRYNADVARDPDSLLCLGVFTVNVQSRKAGAQ